MKTQWKKITNPPKVGGEYNVIWKIPYDNYCVVTTMFYNAINKNWYATMDEKVKKTKEVIKWTHLPSLPIELENKNKAYLKKLSTNKL